jgi:hypothetical protein
MCLYVLSQQIHKKANSTVWNIKSQTKEATGAGYPSELLLKSRNPYHPPIWQNQENIIEIYTYRVGK